MHRVIEHGKTTGQTACVPNARPRSTRDMAGTHPSVNLVTPAWSCMPSLFIAQLANSSRTTKQLAIRLQHLRNSATLLPSNAAGAAGNMFMQPWATSVCCSLAVVLALSSPGALLALLPLLALTTGRRRRRRRRYSATAITELLPRA